MQMSALDAYTSRVYQFVVLIVPAFCLCTGVTITLLCRLGWYPQVALRHLLLFDLSNLLYMGIGCYFMMTGFGDDGIVLPRKLRAAKYTMAAILLIQWNVISYLWPFSDLWAYCVLFTLVEAVFFDTRLVAFTTAGITLSMLVSWFFMGERLLPLAGPSFRADMTFRLVGLVLMLFTVNLVTYFGGKFLIGELEKHANIDPLTRLLNRRGMDAYLQTAYRQARVGGSPFCLLMLDIDDFKKVNDTYGHDCGDDVLRAVAGAVTFCVTRNDTVFRWGGEEILVLLYADEEQAKGTAEWIRRDIESMPVKHRNQDPVTVTVSIGLSAYRHGLSVQDMMDDADAKLYYAKRHGKNRVVSAIPGQ